MTTNRRKVEADIVFIDKKEAEQWKCGICLDIIKDPVDIKCSGGHIYCYQCIQELVSSNGINGKWFNCPQCKNKCNKKSIRKLPVITRTINRLKVKCKNHEITPQRAILFSKKRRPRRMYVIYY